MDRIYFNNFLESGSTYFKDILLWFFPDPKIHKQKTYRTEGIHTRLFLVSSLEKLNYRRRSIRLFALLLDATAYWHRIIPVLFGSVSVCVCVCDQQAMTVKVWYPTHMNASTPIPLYTHFSLHLCLAIRFGSSSVSHFSQFSRSFFFGLFFRRLHNTNTCERRGAQTDRQNWSHQLTHEMHHYHERTCVYLCAYLIAGECAPHTAHGQRATFRYILQEFSTLAVPIVVEWSGFYSALWSREVFLLPALKPLDRLVFIHFVLSSTFFRFLLSSYCFLCSRSTMSQFDFSVFMCSVSALPHDGFVADAFAISLACLRALKWNGIVSARFCNRTQTPYRRCGL